MKINNIVTKLWVIMTILVLVVIGIAGAAQTSFMEGLYYEQQAEQLKVLGNKVADIARAEHDPVVLDQKLALIAELYDANVMILNEKGIVIHCQGMGISTKDMPMDMNNPHHSPMDLEDIKKLYQGQVVVHRGNNPYFNTDVLSVGIPFKDTHNIDRVIMIHAPLKPLADELKHLQMLAIYTAVGGIVLAALLSLIFSRVISKPLVKMNKAALAMASGNYQQRVDIQTNDEIGLLANSLNTLASRLQEKISQLEKQEQIRREFVTNVAHEIKTPLAVMQGFTETMIDGLVKTEQERDEYLNNILEEINRLKRLVNEVLDLKRMEEGHFDFDQEPCDLREIIDRVRRKLTQLAVEKDIHFEIGVEKNLPLVTCNSDRIEQVLINLIDNAIRHTHTGGRVILRVSSKANQVHLRISDTGEGIAPEDLPMIWERFYKGDKSRTRARGGTGLGLAIVKRIVEGHGGQINVDSKLNVGTTFNIVLPVNNCSTK
ncbi:integral membrane sensor signal transduction histidine kinase [Desulfotomaculum nigrificans CO-1-SRB]|uniref:histidine kinase n=1 Tax=Desulfotomaculum nigrificans (strain DSM 14880 / VKM B-2319 / CO-1-SRB) TaxID=868595 RepID=F6B6E8_DESCC|nr:HAMP domain-containing sensor histidine kinase [Desulfotomaculum nigrificans]AEF93219.1 integral membrane sensor signal transduction histidine kinase [Desulfotomaculum nigrificans CO-1-SRB]